MYVANDFKISSVNAVFKIEIVNERKITFQFLKKERTVTSQSFFNDLSVHVTNRLKLV